MTAQRIIRSYLTITGLFNGALALIWGVNTLFLLQAGLDIFHVMLVNAAFSFAEFLFEIPTGVVADTLGRRASLLLCLFTLLGSTLAYVALPALGFTNVAAVRTWYEHPACVITRIGRLPPPDPAAGVDRLAS